MKVTKSSVGSASRVEPTTARGRRSRQSLLEAAQRVFSRDGFADARITDIADEAGAAHGSFYRYFDSKEEIFIALLRELEEELWSPGHRGQKSSSGDPYDVILQANTDYIRAYLENREIMVVWEQVATLNSEVEALRRAASDRFAGRIEKAIVAWQSAGIADAGLDPRYAAAALTGMVSNFVYRWCATGEDFEIEKAAEQLSLLWSNSIRPRNP